MTESKKSNQAEKKVKPPKKKRRVRIVLLIILVVLIIARLILPYVVLHYANKTLATMQGYYGHVEDIDLALIRGAYKLDNIYINKVDSASHQQTAFFRSEMIDLSIEWKALLHGSIVGELVFERPMLRFTKDKAELNEVKKDSSDFRILLKKFMPLKINRFEINHGVIAYNDSSSTPVLSLEMTDTYVLAENLKSVYAANDLLPATIKAHAYLYKGNLKLDMKMNPLAEQPTFDLNSELSNTNLPELNEFFKAYGKFDVNRGTFGLYTEMAAKEGQFKGYVKPIIKDLDVLGPEDRKDSFLHKLWEGFVGTVGVIFRNQSKGQIATKVPIEGNFKNLKMDVLDAVEEVVVNAFIQALVPSIDNEISLKSVKPTQPEEKKGFFKKIFSRKEKGNKKEKKKGK